MYNINKQYIVVFNSNLSIALGGLVLLVTMSCLTLATPWTVTCQAPLSMEFSGQEYWSGLPFPSPGDLPDPEMEPGSPASPPKGVAYTVNLKVMMMEQKDVITQPLSELILPQNILLQR